MFFLRNLLFFKILCVFTKILKDFIVFLQIFLQWQIENSELIQSSQEEKDKNISYMHKMNGLGDVDENKRRNQLKNWIYTSFSKEFVINEYI